MKPIRKLKNKNGFTLAELMIVVAIIAVLCGVAFTMVNPQKLSYVEYNRSAESIAVAAQNRLTALRNEGDMTILRTLGVRSDEGAKKVSAFAASTASAASNDDGGYRYLFNYSVDESNVITKTSISYILPFGSIDTELTENYIAIGFQADTGMIGEVFYSTQPFGERSIEYLLELQNSEIKRRAENVGYYQGMVDEQEVAFANLPTPQLTITNYEQLTLDIYLPKVKQLEQYGKQIGFVVSLADEDDEAYGEKHMSYEETAIYSTFPIAGNNFSPDLPIADSASDLPMLSQTIKSGRNYTMILDTVKSPYKTQMDIAFPETDMSSDVPMGKFEDWARRSKACRTEKNTSAPFKLGDNSLLTVTVYCLNDDREIDTTFMPRSASIVFNGWFNKYSSGSVDIACGRHLQNLNNLTELNSKLAGLLPSPDYKDGKYIYNESDYNYGKAYYYTDGGESKVKGYNISYDDITNKYKLRSYVKTISSAKQIKAIDFDCSEWKNDSEKIPFTPINLPYDFTYYGNYLTINHLYVDAPFYAGLFGYAYHPNLYDMLLVNPSVNSQMPAHIGEIYEIGVGALIGTSRHSDHINNCQVYMTAEPKTDVEGKTTSGYYPDKYRITGEGYVGGLIGFGEDEHIANCSASVYTGYKKGQKEGKEIFSIYVGGLIGCITGDSSISNCYAAGYLTGQNVGGLVGYIIEDSDPSGDDYRIETCYTAGHIEYASVSASGLIGNIREFSGTARSAVSIYGNYCAVIYGETKDQGKTYSWNSTAPIYGTFEGDGFEWIRTSSLNGYSDAYISDTYGKSKMFAGAVFENDNYNYYIPQKKIAYSTSSYFKAMKDTVLDFVNNSASKTSAEELKSLAETTKNKLFWLKKKEILKDMKDLMEEIIRVVEEEKGTDSKGNLYADGGFRDSDNHVTEGAVWLWTKRAKIDYETNVTRYGAIKLTVQQAVHAMYDGTYTEVTAGADGSLSTATKTITITDGDDGQSVIFMDLYKKLNDAYDALIDGSDPAKVEAANNTIKELLTDKTTETYKEKETDTEVKQFYQAGEIYKDFYTNLLYRVFDKGKDYYEKYVKDEYGELIYRYYRSLVEDKFRDMLCDLAMTDTMREEFQYRSKLNVLDEVLTGKDGLQDIIDISSKWTETEITESNGNLTFTGLGGGLNYSGSGTFEKVTDEDYGARILGFAKDAKDAIEKLRDAVKDMTKTTAEMFTNYESLKNLIETANEKLTALYKYIDETKICTFIPNGKKDKISYYVKDIVDVIVYKYDDYGRKLGYEVKDGNTVYEDAEKTKPKYPKDKDGNPIYETEEDDMREIRGRISYYYSRPVELVVSTINSGAEKALEELMGKLSKTSPNVVELKNSCIADLNLYLGSDWENCDSGHRIYSAEQLRNLARGYKQGVDKKDNYDEDIRLHFMYDYGNSRISDEKELNPYFGKIKDDSYVDLDNGVYNNVFPYTISGKDSAYYPYPFVYGREVKDSSFRATYVLFHYGDWLCGDLIASKTEVEEAQNEAKKKQEAAQALSEALTVFNEVQVIMTNSNTNGNIAGILTSINSGITQAQAAVDAFATDPVFTSNEEINTLYQTISEWIKADGTLDKVKGSLKKGDTENLAEIENYKTTLSDLAAQIKELWSI